LKRLLVLAVSSLMVVFLMTSLAAGQSGVAKSSTSSKVSPKRDKKKPYKFKVSGTVKFPLALCAPNAPSSGCLPITCPPGVTLARYCTLPTIARICSGKVKITFKSKRASVSKTTSVSTSCKYKKSVTLKKKGKYKVTAKFGGNTILKSSTASKKNARAG